MSDSVEKKSQVEELDAEYVKRVAMLSRLELTDEEIDHYAKDLTSILHHINELMALDLDDVEPTSHPLPLIDVKREDENAASLPREDSLSNAPEQEDGCFKVPQII